MYEGVALYRVALIAQALAAAMKKYVSLAEFSTTPFLRRGNNGDLISISPGKSPAKHDAVRVAILGGKVEPQVRPVRRSHDEIFELEEDAEDTPKPTAIRCVCNGDAELFTGCVVQICDAHAPPLSLLRAQSGISRDQKQSNISERKMKKAVSLVEFSTTPSVSVMRGKDGSLLSDPGKTSDADAKKVQDANASLQAEKANAAKPKQSEDLFELE
jgi:hypothetical protein